MPDNCPCDAVKRLQDDMDDVKTDISKLYKSEGVFATRLDAIERVLARVEDKLDKLTEKPARRWDTVISEGIKYAVALLLGLLAIKIGLQ